MSTTARRLPSRTKLLVCALIAIATIGVAASLLADTESPGTAARGVYLAAAEGRYSAADADLTPEYLIAVSDAFGGGTREFWLIETRDGALVNVDVLDEEIEPNGFRATARLRLQYQEGSQPDPELKGDTDYDGNPLERQLELVKIDGEWKIDGPR